MTQDVTSIVVETPGVVGGRPRLDGTRVSVATIATWYKRGYSPEEIAEQFEQLALAHVYAALAYYHAHRDAVEADLDAEAAHYDEVVKAHRKRQERV